MRDLLLLAIHLLVTLTKFLGPGGARQVVAEWLLLKHQLLISNRSRVHDGQPLAAKIRSAWEGILDDAGLGEDVVRHSLRLTAATWQMQAGTDLWEAAGWLGMTVEQLELNYGHHHPDFQEEAAKAFGGRR